MHHKRRKPKAGRAGCLLCKPHKLNAYKSRERSRGKREALRHEQRAW